MTYWTDITEDGIAFVTFKATLSNMKKPQNSNQLPRICIGLNEYDEN